MKNTDESTKDTKITVSSETILHGLKKFTNYSMEVLAFTAGGDGVRAPRIYCQTEQDGIDLCNDENRVYIYKGKKAVFIFILCL